MLREVPAVEPEEEEEEEEELHLSQPPESRPSSAYLWQLYFVDRSEFFYRYGDIGWYMTKLVKRNPTIPVKRSTVAAPLPNPISSMVNLGQEILSNCSGHNHFIVFKLFSPLKSNTVGQRQRTEETGTASGEDAF